MICVFSVVISFKVISNYEDHINVVILKSNEALRTISDLEDLYVSSHDQVIRVAVVLKVK